MNVIGAERPVEIMMPVMVAAKFCKNCPEMKLVHKCELLVNPVDPDGNSGYLKVRQRITCENLSKCRNILLAKEGADE